MPVGGFGGSMVASGRIRPDGGAGGRSGRKSPEGGGGGGGAFWGTVTASAKGFETGTTLSGASFGFENTPPASFGFENTPAALDASVGSDAVERPASEGGARRSLTFSKPARSWSTSASPNMSSASRSTSTSISQASGFSFGLVAPRDFSSIFFARSTCRL